MLIPVVIRIALVILLTIPLGLTPSLAQTSAKPLTNADLISMTKAGLSDDVILGLMKTTPGQYDRTPDALVHLKQNGVSNRVIEAVVSGIRDTPASPRPPGQSPTDTLAQLPTTYGYYVLDGNRLVEMPPKTVTTRIGLSPGNTGDAGYAMDGLEGDPPLTVQSDTPYFLIYQQQVNAQNWHLSSAVFVGDKVAQNFNIINTQPMFFRNVYGVDQNQVVRINLWRPRRTEVPLRVQPIPEKPGMFRLIPETPLGAGRYILFAGTNVSPEGTVITAARDRKSWALYFERRSTAGAKKLSPALPELVQQIEMHGQLAPGTEEEFAAFEDRENSRHLKAIGFLDVFTIPSTRGEIIAAAQAKDWSTALTKSLSILTKDPQDWLTHVILAGIYPELGDLTKALSHADRALRAFRHRTLYVAVADIYVRLGDKTKALAWLEKALAAGVVQPSGKRYKIRNTVEEILSAFAPYRDDPEFQRLVQTYGLQSTAAR